MLRSRLASEEDAADLMQEAYLRLLRYRHCGADSLRFLLLRVAMNLVVSHRRQAAIRKQVLIDDLERKSDRGLPGSRATGVAGLDCSAGATSALSPNVYILSRVGGLRQREIAERCGISTRMVEHYIAKAKLLIRERIG
jgi:DNA-directed RNA polymerase specialized sigma24 family protein